MALTFGLAVFVRPILAVLGPHYVQFAFPAQIACVGGLVQSLNCYNNTIFTATDRVRHGVAATAIRCASFGGSFWPLCQQFHLTGAVISWLLAETAYHAASLFLLHRDAVIKVPIAKTYLGVFCSLPVAVLLWTQVSQKQYLVGAALAWVAMLIFFATARYTSAEIGSIARLMISFPANRQRLTSSTA